MSTFTYGCIRLLGGRARANGHRALAAGDQQAFWINRRWCVPATQPRVAKLVSFLVQKMRPGSGGRWRWCSYLGGQTDFLSQASKMPLEVQAPFSVSGSLWGRESLFAPLLWSLLHRTPSCSPPQASHRGALQPFFSFSWKVGKGEQSTAHLAHHHLPTHRPKGVLTAAHPATSEEFQPSGERKGFFWPWIPAKPSNQPSCQEGQPSDLWFSCIISPLPQNPQGRRKVIH